MTMTIDLPGEIVEKVRSEASLRGGKVEVLLLEKIRTGLASKKKISNDRPWMKHFGFLRDLHDERKEIDSLWASKKRSTDPMA